MAVVGSFPWNDIFSSQEIVQLNDYLYFKDGRMLCEKVSVDDVRTSLENHQVFPASPFFLYSKAQILKNVDDYKQLLGALGIDYTLNYAMKANPNLELLRLMKEQGCSVTLVSGMELKLALELGFEPCKLILNGNGKLNWELKLAITVGCPVNIDSEVNLRQTIDMCRMLNKGIDIYLRINPDIDTKVHGYLSTGREGTKFGLPVSKVDNMLESIKHEPLLHLVGLHCHLGSTISSTTAFRTCTQLLLRLLKDVLDKGFPLAKQLNIGGGLGIPYRTHAYRTMSSCSDPVELRLKLESCLLDQPTTDSGITRMCHSTADTLRSYLDGKSSRQELLLALEHTLTDVPAECTCRHIQSLLAEAEEQVSMPTPQDLIDSIADIVKGQDVTIILEPGRSLVGNAAVLITSVLGCKTNGSKNFVIVDGAMTEVIRPSLYNAYHHIELIEPSLSEDKEKRLYDIVGPVCECTDFLGKNRLLTTPHVGCGLAVLDVGAYCASMASNYNMRLRPAEVLVDGSSWRLIRRPDTYDDLLRPYKELPTLQQH